jgi:hypothetical protein
LRLSPDLRSFHDIGECLSAGVPVITNMVNAAGEFPSDAVIYLDSVLSTDEFAARLLELLRDPEQQRCSSAAALAHAQEATFSRLADQLICIVESISESERAVGGALPARDAQAAEWWYGTRPRRYPMGAAETSRFNRFGC